MPSLHAVILGIALALGLGGSLAGNLAVEDARLQLLYRPESALPPSPCGPWRCRPTLNLTPEQLAIAARRSRAVLQAKLECSALDTRLPVLERAVRRAKPDVKAEAEHTLSLACLRYTVLRC
jgi:hypothetical protein